METQPNSLRVFLNALFADIPPAFGDCCTTVVGFNGRGPAKFIESASIDAIEHMANIVETHRNDPGTNIYIRPSILRGVPAAHKRGSEDDTVACFYLYADLDVYRTAYTISDALHALETFDKPPTLVTFTGRGVQAYWRLLELCDDIMRLKACNRWLQEQFSAFGADSTFDLSRVLRVPTTFNHKTSPPTKADLIQVQMDRRYPLGEFGWSSTKPFTYDEPVVQEELENPDTFLAEMKRKNIHIYRRIFSAETAKQDGAPLTSAGNIDRSKNEFHIAVTLLSLGYTPGQVAAVLTHPTWFSGSKFRDGLRYHYVNETVQNAWAQVRSLPDPEEYFAGKRHKFIPKLLAEALANSQRLLLLTSKDGELVNGIWYYEDGKYKATGELAVRQDIAERLGEHWSPTHSESTLKYLRDSTLLPTYSIYQKPDFLDLPDVTVNTLSGMVEVATGHMRPHNPADMSFVQLPVRYNPYAKTCAIDHFVREVLPEDALDAWWEFVGYCLLGDCRFKKALLLIGQQNSGKTTILELLRLFLGLFNTTAIPMQTLFDFQFSRERVFHTFANIYSDSDTTMLKNSGALKIFTSGDSMQAEKKHQQPFDFYPTSKLAFATNAFMYSADPEVDAYVDRFLVIELERHFGDGLCENDKKADEVMIRRLATPENFEEMLNLALTGLRRLLTNRRFTQGLSMERAENAYRSMLDSVYSFFMATTEIETDHPIPKHEIYSRYTTWCGADEQHRQGVGEVKFWLRLSRIAEKKLGLHERQVTLPVTKDGVTEKKRENCYVGRRWKPEWAPTTLPKKTTGLVLTKTRLPRRIFQ